MNCFDIVCGQLQAKRKSAQLRSVFGVALVRSWWDDEIEAKSGEIGTVIELNQHGFGVISLDAWLGIQLLDLRVDECHYEAVRAIAGATKKSCALTDTECESRQTGAPNVFRLRVFRAQQIRIHEQTIEEDINAAG